MIVVLTFSFVGININGYFLLNCDNLNVIDNSKYCYIFLLCKIINVFNVMKIPIIHNLKLKIGVIQNVFNNNSIISGVTMREKKSGALSKVQKIKKRLSHSFGRLCKY